MEHEPEPLTRDHKLYSLHKPVIKESAGTTKVRIVFDASTKENFNVPSLNECLHKGYSITPQRTS